MALKQTQRNGQNQLLQYRNNEGVFGKFIENYQTNSSKSSLSSQTSFVNKINSVVNSKKINMVKSTGNLRSWFQQKFVRSRRTPVKLHDSLADEWQKRSTSEPNLGSKSMDLFMKESYCKLEAQNDINIENDYCEIFFC